MAKASDSLPTPRTPHNPAARRRPLSAAAARRELILAATRADAEHDEVEPLTDAEAAKLTGGKTSPGIRVYRVTAASKWGGSVEAAGVAPGNIVVVDEVPERFALRSGDVVLVRLAHEDGHQVVVLRQYLEPGKLYTNHKDGADLVIPIDDPDLRPEVVGVVRERLDAEGRPLL